MNAAQNYNRLKNNLDKLKLTEIMMHLDDYMQMINKGDKTVEEGLLEMTELEIRAKDIRAQNACVKVANFPFIKTFDDFDFTFQPSIKKEELLSFKNLSFIENSENILFVGSPGVGKTHLSVAIGVEAATNRKSTYFIHCNDLLIQLKRANLENRLEERLKFFSKYKVLIIDEVGFLPFDNEGSKLFFQLVSRRYEKKPTIITTNKPLSQWGEIFGDVVLANAILDRLLHHSRVIKIVGRSYRTKDIQLEFNSKNSAE